MSYAALSRKSAPVTASATKAASKAASGGLRIGQVNDSFEQEADRVADQVMAGESAGKGWSLSNISIAAPLQRKCSCGGSNESGECEECKKKETLQRKASGTTTPSIVPPIVHEVLNSAGKPLDKGTRDFFEPRFGQDFSSVRIHAGDQAAASARAVHARAYAVGSDIVFGTGEYRPHTDAGQRLIAHELAHTLQQRPTLARQPMEPPRDSPSPTPGGSGTLPQSPAAKTASSPSVPQPPARGPNPADCMKPLCQKISTLPTPTTDDKAVEMGNNWATGALACVDGGAAASNASHSADIVANEDGEIADEAKVLNDDFKQQKPRPGRRQDYVKNLVELCQQKQREIYLEFFYNVIFENPARATLKWGYNPDWNQVEGALSALPIEATWGNPHLLRFRRAECHPSDVDASGQCRTRGKLTGGITEPAAGNVDTITVFNAGVGGSPYDRSKSLRLPATSQTIRHEVGHVMDELISPADRATLFETIMHWHEYSWAWITATGSAVPQNYQDERNKLSQETGKSGAQLDQWLASLATSTPVTVGKMTYSKEPVGGGPDFMLNSYQTDQMPQGDVFEYARTDKGEYIAELYALAVSRPEFLSSVLPSAQRVWLQEAVFHTDLPAMARQLALGEPQLTEFLTRGSLLYTREQLQALLNEILTSKSKPGTQMA